MVRRGNACALLILVTLVLACENPLTNLAKRPRISILQDATQISTGESVDFGTVSIGSTKDISFTIENTGTAALTLTNIPRVVLTGSTAFAVQGQLPSSVAAGATATFAVRFTPLAAGLQTTMMTVKTDDPDLGTYSIALSGSGGSAVPQAAIQAGATHIAPGGSFDLGSTTVNSPKDVVFTVQNTSTAALTLPDPAVTISGADAGLFSVAIQPGSPVAAGSSTSFTLRFNPDSAGAKSATVSVASNDPAHNPYAFTVTGTGTVTSLPTIAVTQASAQVPSGSSFEFGATISGTHKDVVFTVQNTGTAALTFPDPSVTISGADTGLFSVVTQPGSPVAAGSDTTFTLRFSPDSAGAKSATVSVASDDPAHNPYAFTVTGTGANPAPDIFIRQDANDISPGTGSYDFGTVLADIPVFRIFIIENRGSVALNLSGSPLVTLSGTDSAEFAVTTPPSSTVSAGGSTPFVLRFTPNSMGGKTATVEVVSNDTVKGTYSFTLSGSGMAAVISLPKTGAGTIDGYTLDPREDGQLQRGVAWPSPRFSVGTGLETTCIIDSLTGLMWAKNPSAGSMTWLEALAYCKNLTFGGYTDWRLPNRAELQSLANRSEGNISTWLNSVGFVGAPQIAWSSTTIAWDTARVWELSGNGVDFPQKDSTTSAWAVRSSGIVGPISLPRTGAGLISGYALQPGEDGDARIGVAWPSPRFTDNGDGTVSDKLTGFVWEAVPSATPRSWADALGYCETLALGGYTDWRLPNINELASLVNAGESVCAAWLNSQGFSGVQSGRYWSSTTYVVQTSVAWITDFQSGQVGVVAKADTINVWAMRGGQ